MSWYEHRDHPSAVDERRSTGRAASESVLTVRDTGNCPCEPAEHLLRQRIAELDAELARLDALRVNLVRMVDALPDRDCPQPEPGTWCPPAMRR